MLLQRFVAGRHPLLPSKGKRTIKPTQLARKVNLWKLPKIVTQHNRGTKLRRLQCWARNSCDDIPGDSSGSTTIQYALWCSWYDCPKNCTSWPPIPTWCTPGLPSATRHCRSPYLAVQMLANTHTGSFFWILAIVTHSARIVYLEARDGDQKNLSFCILFAESFQQWKAESRVRTQKVFSLVHIYIMWLWKPFANGVISAANLLNSTRYNVLSAAGSSAVIATCLLLVLFFLEYVRWMLTVMICLALLWDTRPCNCWAWPTPKSCKVIVSTPYTCEELHGVHPQPHMCCWVTWRRDGAWWLFHWRNWLWLTFDELVCYLVEAIVATNLLSRRHHCFIMFPL